MAILTSGINRTGGKYRLTKELLNQTPYHSFFLSAFLGSAVYEINKPRCQYEIFNDIDSEIINYLEVVKCFPEEFDKMKDGIFGLVSRRIFNDIINGNIEPENRIEQAFFFYYTNKLAFGGNVKKDYRGLTMPSMSKKSIEETEKVYFDTLRKFDVELEEIREKKDETVKTAFRGVIPSGLTQQIQKSIGTANYRGIVPKTIANYKGINPKTTRPYSNNDCGLLTPLNPDVIKRLRYVNLTDYPFQKVYKTFYKAFFERKGLTEEVFCYFDPPYPATEQYYGSGFGEEDHQDLIDIMINSPFRVMTSIGGECEKYLEAFENREGWIVKPVYTKYSTDAMSQKQSRENLIMNYKIGSIPKMKADFKQKRVI